MLGQISTINQNLMRGEPTGVENRFVFIGSGGTNSDQLNLISHESDLELTLGTGDLYDNVKAFSDNALVGGSFSGAVYPLAEKSLDDAIEEIIASGYSAELLIFCDEVFTKESIEDFQILFNGLKALGMYQYGLVALPKLDAETQTWAAYQTFMNSIVSALKCENLVGVPQFCGNNIGVLAGRLCREDLSVSDTPIRTKSGAVLGLGEFPVDVNGMQYNNAIASGLAGIRLSVPQTYSGQAGIYWSDSTTFDSNTGDYQSTDVLRPMLKAMRKVHARMFGRLGDRSLNNTPASIKAGESYAAKPLRDMAKATPTKEADIYPPEDGDVVITFTGKSEIEVSLGLKPINGTKKIINKLYVKGEA